MKFEGFDELMAAFNAAASDSEIEKVDIRIIDQAKQFVYRVMQQKIPVSSDNSLSGRGLKGGGTSRPKSGHAKSNIPISKTKKTKSGAYADVGWKLEDNSEYFYMKFINWGTLYMPPRDFTYSTRNEAEAELTRIAESEYQRFLNERLK